MEQTNGDRNVVETWEAFAAELSWEKAGILVSVFDFKVGQIFKTAPQLNLKKQMPLN
jgi:hypothetical protein